MRLWHERLLPVLPRQQLLGQHRECCALRGLGWGKPHSVVNYVFDHPREWLCAYHMEVIRVMRERGYTAAPEWKNPAYRGKACEPDGEYSLLEFTGKVYSDELVYPEHDDDYLRECIDNLRGKGIEVSL